MTLPCSPNSISMNQMNVEIGLDPTAKLGMNREALRETAGIPSPGTISFDDLRCKSYESLINFPLFQSQPKVYADNSNGNLLFRETTNTAISGGLVTPADYANSNPRAAHYATDFHKQFDNDNSTAFCAGAPDGGDPCNAVGLFEGSNLAYFASKVVNDGSATQFRIKNLLIDKVQMYLGDTNAYFEWSVYTSVLSPTVTNAEFEFVCAAPKVYGLGTVSQTNVSVAADAGKLWRTGDFWLIFRLRTTATNDYVGAWQTWGLDVQLEGQ